MFAAFALSFTFITMAFGQSSHVYDSYPQTIYNADPYATLPCRSIVECAALCSPQLCFAAAAVGTGDDMTCNIYGAQQVNDGGQAENRTNSLLMVKGTDACGFIECLNGGSCVNLGHNYTCSCPEGYTGRHCETDTRPTCSHLQSAAAMAVYDSTAGITQSQLRGISISSIDGSVAAADYAINQIHVMDAELNQRNVIVQSSPWGTTYDDKGFLYVTDYNGNKVHVYENSRDKASSFGSYGTGPGQFNYVKGITYKAGVLYVCDAGNKRVQVFQTNGTFIAAFGNVHFDSNPLFIAIDEKIYVSDQSGTFYILTSTYTLINKFIYNQSPLYSIVRGIALYNGCLVVADRGSSSIKVFDGNYSLLAAIGSYGRSAGQLDYQQGIAVTPLGAIYVADRGNKRVQLFNVP